MSTDDLPTPSTESVRRDYATDRGGSEDFYPSWAEEWDRWFAKVIAAERADAARTALQDARDELGTLNLSGESRLMDDGEWSYFIFGQEECERRLNDWLTARAAEVES